MTIKDKSREDYEAITAAAHAHYDPKTAAVLAKTHARIEALPSPLTGLALYNELFTRAKEAAELPVFSKFSPREKLIVVFGVMFGAHAVLDLHETAEDIDEDAWKAVDTSLHVLEHAIEASDLINAGELGSLDEIDAFLAA